MTIKLLNKVASKEGFVTAGVLTLATLTLYSCTNEKNNVIKTPIPDLTSLTLAKNKATESLGVDAKYLGEPLSSFKVSIPANPDGSKPASDVSGTIFEVKTDTDTLSKNHFTLGLFVPDNSPTPVPILINNISSDPGSLIETTVVQDGANIKRYGIAGMPLDEQYLDAFIHDDVNIEGPLNKFLKKDSSGNVVPLYTVLFNDITPDNVGDFVDHLSQLKDPQEIKDFILSHVYGVTFSDLKTGNSAFIKLDTNNKKNIKDFIANLFFGSDMTAQAKGLSSAEMTAQAATSTAQPTSTEVIIPATATDAPTEIPASPTPEAGFVTEGSELAKYVPIGLKYRVEGGTTIVTNALGEDIVVAENGVRAEWLQAPLATTQEDTKAHPDLYKISGTYTEPTFKGGPQITKQLASLYVKQFPEGTNACKPGDIGTEDVNGKFKNLKWKGEPGKAPALILGYFTVDYNGLTLFGKITQWLTNEGIVFVTVINHIQNIDIGKQNGILPVGLGQPGTATSKSVEPMASILRGIPENDELNAWIKNGCPSANAENYFFIFGPNQ